jgi:hypothetical protein
LFEELELVYRSALRPARQSRHPVLFQADQGT